MLEPACWSWELPPARNRDDAIAALLAEQADRPADERYSRAALELMLESARSGVKQ